MSDQQADLPFDQNDEEIDLMEEKRRWAVCLQLEKQLHEYVLQNSQELYNQSPPRFIPYQINGKDAEKAPEYIRWIGKLHTGHDAEFLKQLQALKEAYEYAKHKHFDGTYPLRYARYYENVENITTSANEAYKSWRLKGIDGQVLIKNTHISRLANPIEFDFQKLESEAKKLSHLGLKAYAFIRIVFNIPTHLQLYVEEKALYNYFDTEHIQAREHTGTHYRARIRHVSESKGERIPFSFIVMDSTSPIEQVYHSLPQAPRPHQLRKIGKQLDWPMLVCELNYLLYDKEE